jgi:hypothetical protein
MGPYEGTGLRRAVRLAAFLCYTISLLAQPSLSLVRQDSAPVVPGSAIGVNLVLSGTSGSNLAALQWNLGATAGQVSTTVRAGITLNTSASVACTAGSTTCLLYNAQQNTSALTDGTIASLTVTIPSSTSAVTLSLSGTLGASLSGNPVTVTAGPALTIAVGTHIDAGSSTDQFFSGGYPFPYLNLPAGAPMPTMRFSDRGGSFTYSIPVPGAGDYILKLGFIERIVTGPGQHAVSVSANGAPLLTGYDIFADVGANVPVTKTFTVTAASSPLVLVFSTGIRNATVNTIDVAAAPPKPPPPATPTFLAGTLAQRPATCPGTGLVFYVVSGDNELFWCMAPGPWIGLAQWTPPTAPKLGWLVDGACKPYGTGFHQVGGSISVNAKDEIIINGAQMVANEPFGCILQN